MLAMVITMRNIRMKLKNITRGFTLFVAMLVLGLLSAVAVTALQYKKHHDESDAARLYGEKLYAYGQAVERYFSDADNLSSTGLLPGTANGSNPVAPPAETQDNQTWTITLTGVDWLKKDNAGVDAKGYPYLSDDFTLQNFNPLEVAAPDENGQAIPEQKGDQSIQTVFTYHTSGNPAPSLLINAGVLFLPSSELDPQTNEPLSILEPTLTQEAIQRANTMYKSASGAPAIFYTYEYVDATGALLANAKVSGSIHAAGLTSAFLRTDGNSQMDGAFSFDPTLASTPYNAIEEVNGIGFDAVNAQRINFPASSVNAIKNLTNLTFKNGSVNGSISGIGSINMTPTAQAPTITGVETLTFPVIDDGNPRAITGLQDLIFDSVSTTNAISNIKTISFANGRVFRNLKVWTSGILTTPAGQNSTEINLRTNNGNNVCMLTAFTRKDYANAGDGRSQSCYIYTLGVGQPWKMQIASFRLSMGGPVLEAPKCQAVCLDWG
jgi:type II secretory pathway pseudopilin PulG